MDSSGPWTPSYTGLGWWPGAMTGMGRWVGKVDLSGDGRLWGEQRVGQPHSVSGQSVSLESLISMTLGFL